ncbi:hypothetical protein BTE77_35595, partial [Ensifer adhaerens]
RKLDSAGCPGLLRSLWSLRPLARCPAAGKQLRHLEASLQTKKTPTQGMCRGFFWEVSFFGN